VLVFDTGPIVAIAHDGDVAHVRCLNLLMELRSRGERMLLPGTVTAEVGFLIEKFAGPQAEAEFLQGVARGDFEPVPFVADDYARMGELVTQ
jgi:predicted nucleic acid-binding protein